MCNGRHTPKSYEYDIFLHIQQRLHEKYKIISFACPVYVHDLQWLFMFVFFCGRTMFVIPTIFMQ